MFSSVNVNLKARRPNDSHLVLRDGAGGLSRTADCSGNVCWSADGWLERERERERVISGVGVRLPFRERERERERLFGVDVRRSLGERERERERDVDAAGERERDKCGFRRSFADAVAEREREREHDKCDGGGESLGCCSSAAFAADDDTAADPNGVGSGNDDCAGCGVLTRVFRKRNVIFRCFFFAHLLFVSMNLVENGSAIFPFRSNCWNSHFRFVFFWERNFIFHDCSFGDLLEEYAAEKMTRMKNAIDRKVKKHRLLKNSLIFVLFVGHVQSPLKMKARRQSEK